MSGLDWMYWSLVVGLFLALVWMCLREPDDDDQDVAQPGKHERVFDPDPEATVVLAAVPSWYQLDHEGRETKRLLERAAALLDG